MSPSLYHSIEIFWSRGNTWDHLLTIKPRSPRPAEILFNSDIFYCEYITKQMLFTKIHVKRNMAWQQRSITKPITQHIVHRRIHLPTQPSLQSQHSHTNANHTWADDPGIKSECKLTNQRPSHGVLRSSFQLPTKPVTQRGVSIRRAGCDCL